MRALKTATQKRFSYQNKRFWLTSIQGLPYMKTKAQGLKLIYCFINFIFPLPVSYARHCICNCKRLATRLVKRIKTIIRLLRQKDYRGTAEVNDAFKLPPRQLKYRWLYSCSSNTTSVSISYMKELL